MNSRTGLLRQPSVLLLATLVMLVAHPWLSVRRLPAEYLAVTGQVVVIALPGRHVLENGQAPARLWVRRMRGYGFMYHAQAYRQVLIVATGAGIGPVLPGLLGRSPGWRTGSIPCSWSATTWCGTAVAERARRWACRGTADLRLIGVFAVGGVS